MGREGQGQGHGEIEAGRGARRRAEREAVRGREGGQRGRFTLVEGELEGFGFELRPRWLRKKKQSVTPP